MNNRQDIQDAIIASLDFKRLMDSSGELLLGNLLPKGFVYFLLTKEQLLSLYGGALPTFNHVEITSARLFLEPVKEDGSYKNFAISLKLSNGRTLLMPIERQGFDELIPIFHQKGTYVPLNKRRKENARQWETGLMSDHYDKSTYEHYAYLHDQIKTAIKNLIKKNNSLKSSAFGSIKTVIKKIKNKENRSTINIIDGGCGTGNFLRKIAEEMPSELAADKLTRQINLFGFDFNINNVNSTRTKFYVDENTTVINSMHCRVEEGDLTKTDEVIERFSVPSRNAKLAGRQLMLEKDAPTILILSGSLTRLVLNDGFEALKSLQSIASSEKIDYMIGGGIGEPLISDYIAKQLGYKLIPLLPEAQRGIPGITDKQTKFFAFERMSLKEILQIKTKKLRKRNVLDLSLSAQPEKVLAALLDEMNKGTLTIQKNVLVNLSFAKINDEAIRLLKEFISQVPEAKLVMLHHDQTCIDRLTKDSYLNARFSSLRPPSLVTDDIYLAGSKAFFDTLSPLEVVKQLIDIDRSRIRAVVETILQQLLGALFMPTTIEITDIFGNKRIEGEENDILGIYRSVLKLLVENGIDIMTPAQATNDIDVIEFVEEVIKHDDFAKTTSLYSGSKSELFTVENKQTEQITQEQSSQNENNNNLSKSKDL